MDELMFNYATKEYVQARIAEVMFMASNIGGGGGAWLESTMDMQTGALVVDMPIDDVIEAMRNGVLGFVQSVEVGGAWSLSRFYFQVALNQSGDKKIVAAQSYGTATNAYEGTENESGKTVFQVMS